MKYFFFSFLSLSMVQAADVPLPVQIKSLIKQATAEQIEACDFSSEKQKLMDYLLFRESLNKKEGQILESCLSL